MTDNAESGAGCEHGVPLADYCRTCEQMMPEDAPPLPVVASRLPEKHRASLRDWYDDSGPWVERMTALYALVQSVIEDEHSEAFQLAWEQGWVARGNGWTLTDNPYGTSATTLGGSRG